MLSSEYNTVLALSKSLQPQSLAQDLYKSKPGSTYISTDSTTGLSGLQKQKNVGPDFWLVPLIPALGRQRQAHLSEASLVYIANCNLTRAA